MNMTELETRCVVRLALMACEPEEERLRELPTRIAAGTFAFERGAETALTDVPGQLCWAPHVDGGQQLAEDVQLPVYASPVRAVRLAAALKATEPDALVTIVCWSAEGEDLHDVPERPSPDNTTTRGGGAQ